MTAVSGCVRYVKAFAIAAGMVFSLSATVAAQNVQPEEFHVGDRIALTVEGPATFTDTVLVRDGLIISLPNIGDVSLTGVKRANIQTYLTQQIGKYLRDPVVHATALVRISVLGQVGRPGFYSLPSDMLLSDVVMAAGGPTGLADLDRTVVKRGGNEILSREQVASALAAGRTLDELNVAPGDEMVIGQKPGSKFDTALKILGVTVPVLSLLLYLSSRR
jgi:polysaccharide export outer membrane protein